MSDLEPRLSLIGRLGGARVLCVGDVILDHFHYGSVDRISPEAPIPVLKLERLDTMLGGAGNVVRNLNGLGAHVRFVTVIGKDHDGGEIERLLAEENISDQPLVDDSGRRTSSKTRFLANGQQMLRADRETIYSLSAGMEKQLISAAKAAMADCDVVVLSDYRKGVLTDGVIRALITTAQKAGKTVIVDPKGADYERYRGADVITPNRAELFLATAMPVDNDDEIIAAIESLIDDYDFGVVVATRSKDGMTMKVRGQDPVHLKAAARDVFDVSGAGDTVVATLAAVLGAGGAFEEAADLANTAAGIVVGKVGTAVAYTADIAAGLHHLDLSAAETKIMSIGQAQGHMEKWRQSGLAIGFTNGCFDLLHPGHVSLLAKAKAACGMLVVGLNSDASVKRLKGENRPIQGEAARAAVLASLASVDVVIIFGEDTPINLIEAIRPDVLVKGADYKPDEVVGADMVRAHGGRVELIPLEPGHSTTATIAKLAGETC
ncbi:MAG: D-glycero-beta-D-manno-heptose-7-phosphate kinase [Rhodospirillaceae bacterium]|nr:D-glycero-beta-D-manno-heptose-7-phosphate kinase [Rhodospirillaceae bacterium]